MVSISNTTNMEIQNDKDFKKESEREQSLPFVATMEVLNNRLLLALEESENIINGKVASKRYKNFDELVKDVDYFKF